MDRRAGRGLGGSQGMGRAHVEHVAHVCDAGRVESQRLVERRRVLPSRERGGHTTRGARCELEDGRRWVTTAQRQRAGGGLEYTDWGQMRAERTLNMEDIMATLDVSKLSGWLNALAYCRAKMRAYDAGRGAAGRQTGGGGRRRRKERAGESPTLCRSGTDHARSVPRTCSSCL